MDYLYETHMHTSEASGCAVSSAAEQVYSYKKMGYTGVIITDHFLNGYTTCPRRLSWEKKMAHFASGYINAKKAGDTCGLDVFFGWEFTVRGSDFLTYGLDYDFLMDNPNLDRLDVEDYSTLVRTSGGYLAQAHPFRDSYYIEYKYPVSPDLIDGVEVYNVLDRDAANAKALSFAELYDLPVQAGTDSHRSDNYTYSGVKLRKRAETIHDIIDAIMSRDIVLM